MEHWRSSLKVVSNGGLKSLSSRTGDPSSRSDSLVLIIDANQCVRRTIRGLLESHAYAVTDVATAGEALTLVRQRPVHAIIVDLELPDGAAELCKKVRAIDAYRVTPILFVTRSADHEYVAQAFAAGCDDFVSQPIDGLVLRARLKNHLDRFAYFRQLEGVRGELDRYVSKRTREIAEAASRSGKILPPEQRDVVILFSDIRGFTALADDMDPEKLFALLSNQLADQVNRVHEHGGYVDKFGGDGVMAVFDGEDRELASCLAALRMIEGARANGDTGSEKIRQLGIGIHSGRVVVGNIGSPDHLDYSVIGTTVNLAARLCGHANPLSIVVSKAVRDLVADDPRLRFCDEREVPLRGLKQPVVVYTLGEPAL
jgi:adenylate cyclase